MNELSLLNADGLTYDFPSNRLLDGISLSVGAGDKIALIGRNGSGKSTLLKLLFGTVVGAKGSIFSRGDVRYLPQVVQDLESDQTVYDFLNVSSQCYHYEWWEALSHYESLFGGLTFETNQLMRSLSGGEKLKLSLSELLSAKPTVLLLDEPTNNMDINAKESLRIFLNKFQGAFVIVSHDTFFIDSVSNKIWELENGKLTVYGGNYSFYLEQKKLKLEAQQRDYEAVEKKVAIINESIEQEKKRAARSQSMSKKMAGDRSTGSAERGYFKDKATLTANKNTLKFNKKYEELQETLTQLKVRKLPRAYININRINSKEKTLIEVLNTTLINPKGSIITEPFSFSLSGSQRVAFLGDNGSGKSTFVNALLLKSGYEFTNECYRVAGLRIGFISQKYENVDREKTVLENILAANSDLTMTEARMFLSNFLFKDVNDINKYAAVLSGGELARLSFAIACCEKIDLLILDEPTNNLDTNTVEVLIDSLNQFDGALLVVSHTINFLAEIGIEKAYKMDMGRFITMRSLPEDKERFYQEIVKKT